MTDRTIHCTAPLRVDARGHLAASTDLPPNVRADTAEEVRDRPGWRIDDHCSVIGVEPPGPPLPDGPFAAVAAVLERYEMAPPAIVRAAWYEDEPLVGRTILLEGRFWFLRFPMPVRVGELVDVQRRVGGRPVQVRGWSYRTLEGHLEQGRMHWAVWKWLDTGRIEFRIHAFSSRGRIRNPIVLLGFVLFGRWTQARFYRGVFDRMARLVADRTGAPRDTTSSPCEPVDPVERVTRAAGDDAGPRGPQM